MDKRFLAVCVMTYKHPDTVDTVLGYWVQMIKELGFDIYYFDSSPDDDTEKIVKKYQQESKHVFYIRIPSEMSPDDKFLIPYDRSALQYEYSYFWPVKDRSFPDVSLIVNIYQKLLAGCDVLELNTQYANEVFFGNRYDSGMSVTDFYRDFAWDATDFIATIYNYDTVLAEFDWNEIHERYFFNEKCYFPHTAALFHNLAKLENPNIQVLTMGENNNTLKSMETKSMWRDCNAGIDIFGNYWPKVNYALPSIYDDYKMAAIRKETNHPVLFGSVDGLISLHFSDPDSHKYSDPMLSHWEDFSDVPVEIARDISNGSFDSAYADFVRKFERYVKAGDREALAMLCHTNTWIKIYTPFCNDSENARIFEDSLQYFDEAANR
ncbi:MAG: hypothetical protein II133_06825 [Lachnospiraceae bacterium]|nr:hypothetical protein [Lachnospiraceae bacterium]